MMDTDTARQDLDGVAEQMGLSRSEEAGINRALSHVAREYTRREKRERDEAMLKKAQSLSEGSEGSSNPTRARKASRRASAINKLQLSSSKPDDKLLDEMEFATVSRFLKQMHDAVRTRAPHIWR